MWSFDYSMYKQTIKSCIRDDRMLQLVRKVACNMPIAFRAPEILYEIFRFLNKVYALQYIKLMIGNSSYVNIINKNFVKNIFFQNLPV